MTAQEEIDLLLEREANVDPLVEAIIDARMWEDYIRLNKEENEMNE